MPVPSFELPPLPYETHELTPHISSETVQLHYNKHHQGYVNNLNNLVEGHHELDGKTLEELICTASGPVFNNAAQVWNHTFYWQCMSPQGGGMPHGPIAAAIDATFGSFAWFQEEFSKTAAGQFGSGWAWLVQDANKQLLICSTQNALNPLQSQQKPLLTCDVWEHAYYVDYRNLRPKYIEAWWNLVNWDFVNTQLDQAQESE
ncbi:MAG: superoxide dismutase [Myxococcota bacterium]